MDINKILDSYDLNINDSFAEAEVKKITSNISSIYKIETLKKIFGFIDLTTLNHTDTPARAKSFADKVNNFKSVFPDMPNVAAICVYPTLAEHVKKNLNVENVNIASVVGGFPSSQTFIEIKEAETKKAIDKGANEADMVISVGTFLSGDYKTVFDEIKTLKKAVGSNHLKVILESGSLENLKNVKKASVLAVEAGGDFLKTSTGKTTPAATLEAVYVMAQTAKEYFKKTGKKVGIKPAGGISDSETALKYYAVMDAVLGEEWLTPDLFRIGASSLANNLLNDIIHMSSEKTEDIKYF
ncbi:MAG: deoxyribose-phosphate aldolase [Chlorobi bacterium]|nr:deoxyribose-phosphate aldolase [Chlorobiota bacterium]